MKAWIYLLIVLILTMIPVKVTDQISPNLIESSKAITQHIINYWNPIEPTTVEKISTGVKRSIGAIRPWTVDLRKKNFLFEQQFYEMMMAIAWHESNFREASYGTSGEIGPFQIKPSTARLIAKKYGLSYKDSVKELLNPGTSATLAAFLILDYILISNKMDEAIKMYNQGPAYKLVKRDHLAIQYLKQVKLKLKSIGFAVQEGEPNEAVYLSSRINGGRQINSF